MNLTALLTPPAALAADGGPGLAPAVAATHPGAARPARPARAAFGPPVSLVSVDEQGRLWVRFSTALAILAAGMVLMAIPLSALWWVSGGLAESGRVSWTEPATTATSTATAADAAVTVTTTGGATAAQLPLAAVPADPARRPGPLTPGH